MLDSTLPRTAALPQRLSILYIAALGMIALLTLTGQVLVQRAIVRLEGDSRIVNIAGRQRMLSQRLTRLMLERAQLDQPQMPLNEKIQADLDTLSANHMGLQFGSSAMLLPGKNSPSVSKQFVELAPHLGALKTIVESALTTETRAGQLAIDPVTHKKLSLHSDSFLAGMDSIVTSLEQEARDRVNRLRRIEGVLLFATIAVLVCEGLFIFSPAVASLRRSFSQLGAISNELRNAKVIAEKANMAKTDFLARVSHELRTPLHAILGMLELVEGNKLQHDQRDRVRVANSASKALLSLVDDLLDVASMEQGREIVLHPTVVDLPELVTSTFEMMRPMAIQKGLQLRLNLDESVPRFITVDGDRLRQVMTNLLQNAIRYTTLGSVHCNVEPRTLSGELSLRIEVVDTGIGVSIADQERIFEPFSRGSQEKETEPFGRRMGLGLSISRAMIEKLNGTITLASVEGKGSVFTMTFPIQPALVCPNLTADCSGRSGATAGVSRVKQTMNPTALIVDDSPNNLLVMRSYMKQLGYRTISVTSLAESIKKFRKHTFDVVLLDRHLHDGDGLYFPDMLGWHLGHLQEGSDDLPLRSTKVFLVTAEIYLHPSEDERLKQFDGILHKPVSLTQLKRAIDGVSRLDEASEFGLPRNDESRFEALRRKLVRSFLEGLPGEISSIREMLVRSDAVGIAFVAHRLIGSAGNAGLKDVSQCGIELHGAASKNQMQVVEQLLSQLENASSIPH